MKRISLLAACIVLAVLEGNGNTFTFALNTMPEGATFALNTMPKDSRFCVETMVDMEGCRSITNAVQVLPIAYWGTGRLTFTHESGKSENFDFTEDGAIIWKPTLSGSWTITTTGGTPSNNGTSTFVLLGGATDVDVVTIADIAFGGGGVLCIGATPIFKDSAVMASVDWFSNAISSGLVKLRAATTLVALDTEEAAVLDLSDLGAALDASSGKVMFSITAEQMAAIDPEAKSMFFRVEVR